MPETGSLSEKEYYTLSERKRFTKAEDDIYDGKLRICDIPLNTGHCLCTGQHTGGVLIVA